MQKEQDNFTILTQAPVHRIVIKMALPTIISMMVTGVYNIVDTYFVGQLDTQSTAAVGVVFSVVFFIQACGFFFGHGSGNYISRELGARRRENAVKMASNGFFYSFLLGMAILIAGLLFLKPLSVLLGSTPTILPYTEQYLGIVLLSAPFHTASLTLNNQMRLQGNAAYSMIGIVSGAILNILLDPIFIFLLGMGIKGAAWATVIGQVVSFLILFFMARHKKNIGIFFKNFTPSWKAMKEIFYGGSPSFMRQGLACLATMTLNIAAGAYGDSAIAAMSIVNRISMLVLAAVIGLCQGFQPICGFCYGAGLYSRLREAFRFTLKLGTIFLLCVTVVGWLVSSSLIGLFRNDPEVIAIGVVAFRWQLCTYALCPFIIGSNMLAQTCRKPVRANILAASRQGLFFIPLIFTLPMFFGLLGVEMCQAVSDVLSFAVTIPIMIYTFKEFAREEVVRGTTVNQHTKQEEL
ncbi:MATE family efflux transporter [Prevotella brunnea]|uniref:Multidrug export protein MepA n=1 Tax=Prevotella brunnea TaxID=2508867 RepID=A0A5C8GKJ4_9BACT|nr:MATE family efflux transporter [Prevotella brunnea]MDR0185177.1 MATE family efflux transporter [Prevotella brunnea]TXJ62455.1 MATE family efflux transporter [Prevotella brunnea]